MQLIDVTAENIRDYWEHVRVRIRHRSWHPHKMLTYSHNERCSPQIIPPLTHLPRYILCEHDEYMAESAKR